MGIIQRLAALATPAPPEERGQTWMDGWSLEELLGFYRQTGSIGFPFFQQTMAGEPEEKIGNDFAGIVHGIYRRNGVVAACMFLRMATFSEATLVWRAQDRGRRGRLFGDSSLEIFERPAPGQTTGDLLARMINDADLVGNSFQARREGRQGVRLKRMRPDFTTIMIGADATPEELADPEVDIWEDLDAEVVGYMYEPGGIGPPVPLIANDVAHFAPIPDPLASYRGMAWWVPLSREVQADNLATTHKAKFFQNAATPNMVVSLNIDDPTKFKEFIDLFNSQHQGAANAYKTLFFGAGAQVEKAGLSFQQMSFRETIGVGEARIAMAAGVPPTLLGTSEGLQGSSLNAGNYAQARRRFSDITMRPLWRNACGSLQHLARPAPAGVNKLWYDADDIPFLKDDALDAARTLQVQGSTISGLVSQGGFKPESVVEAVTTGDLTRLEHTGKLPVQVQAEGDIDTDTDTDTDTDDEETGE